MISPERFDSVRDDLARIAGYLREDSSETIDPVDLAEPAGDYFAYGGDLAGFLELASQFFEGNAVILELVKTVASQEYDNFKKMRELGPRVDQYGDVEIRKTLKKIYDELLASEVRDGKISQGQATFLLVDMIESIAKTWNGSSENYPELLQVLGLSEEGEE